MPKLMKGQTWADAQALVRGRPRFQYPVLVEPKIDEIRCRVTYTYGEPIRWESYAEKPLHNMGGFDYEMFTLMKELGVDELDIGIEVNGNFNDSYRWVRSSTGIPEGLWHDNVRLHLYDMPGIPGPYSVKKDKLESFAELARSDFGLELYCPEGVLCNSAEEVQAEYKRLRAAGFEGAMVKLPDYEYQRTRSWSWMKMKPGSEADGVITELIEAVAQKDDPDAGIRKGDLLGRIGSVRIVMEDGSEAVPHGIGHDLGRDMLSNPERYIGEWIVMSYMERDRKGGYRHPVFERFREAKA